MSSRSRELYLSMRAKTAELFQPRRSPSHVLQSPCVLESLEPRMLMSADVLPGQEITQLGTPYQSTTLQAHAAGLAVDGDPDTSSHTIFDDANAAWQLHFDDNHQFSKIVIHNGVTDSGLPDGKTETQVEQVESFNAIDYYPHQTPSLYRQNAVEFNGVNSLIQVLSDAGQHDIGKSGSEVGDRYRIHARWTIPADADPDVPQILLNVGGATRGYGIAWRDNQLIFLIKDGDNAYAYAGEYIPDGETVDMFFDWESGEHGLIAINGIELTLTEVMAGAGIDTTLTEAVHNGFTIGGTNGNNTFKSAAMIPEIAALIGTGWEINGSPATGTLAYLWIQRDEYSEEVKDFDLPLDEGAGAPVDAATDDEVQFIQNLTWVDVEPDDFLFRWDMDTLDYNLANQTTSPKNVVGPGEYGLASWSDDGPDGILGMPTMTTGPDGVISASTRNQTLNRHSEIFAPSPLYNVDKYYTSWSLYIDSSVFQVPGELTGMIARIIRINRGDGAGNSQGGFGLRNRDSDPYPVTRLFGNEIRDTRIPNVIPIDKWFRIIVEYTPADRNREGGLFRASFDGGITWPFEGEHFRDDNYWFRIGTRAIDETARIFVTDLAYGSDFEKVYAMNNPLPGMEVEHQSSMRDIRVTIRDAADTRDIYVSPILNPENSEYVHPLGPDQLEVDLVGLTGGTVTGGIVKIERISDADHSGTDGAGTTANANVLSIAEVEVYAIPGEAELPVRISEIHYQPESAEGVEFIELLNTSSEAFDLTGIKLTYGAINNESLMYEFSDTDATHTIPANGRIVITSNRAAFIEQYPEVPSSLIADRSFTGQLADNGEMLTLLGPNQGAIQRFSFATDDSWDPRASGAGTSIEIINPHGLDGSWNFAHNWRVSGIDNGTPGRVDPSEGAIPGDLNYDGSVDLADLALLATNFGLNAQQTPATDVRWKHGDLNADGIVNLADLAALATHFGQSGSNGFILNPPAGQTASEALNILNQHQNTPSTDSYNWNHIHNLLNTDEHTEQII